MSQTVYNRETFYIGGYDPRGTRHYYNLYKNESKKQSKVNGIEMSLSSRKRNKPYIQSWKIQSTSEDKKTITQYHCLEWDDIIRKHWKKNFFTLFIDLLYVIKRYVFSGIIVKFARVAPTQMIAAFYPVIFLFSSLFFAAYGSYLFYIFLLSYCYFFIALFLSIVLAYMILEFTLYIGNKLAVFWLLRIYEFSLKYADTQLDDIDERINSIVKYIVHIIKDNRNNNIDEVLFVSHSVGTIMMIPIVSKVLDTLKLSEKELNKISIMTLGECIPIVSFLPKAIRYRETMQNLMSYKGFFWVDYTAFIDGACFPLMDYYEQSCIKVERKPLYLSPRFHKLFSKKKYANLRKNRYLTHFLYLMSTELAGDYDYFKMTAGHESLSTFILKRNHK